MLTPCDQETVPGILPAATMETMPLLLLESGSSFGEAKKEETV